VAILRNAACGLRMVIARQLRLSTNTIFSFSGGRPYPEVSGKRLHSLRERQNVEADLILQLFSLHPEGGGSKLS
jgi:hypothetical protein